MLKHLSFSVVDALVAYNVTATVTLKASIIPCLNVLFFIVVCFGDSVSFCLLSLTIGETLREIETRRQVLARKKPAQS